MIKYRDPAAIVRKYESGGDYTILYGGSHFDFETDAFNQYGFPIWGGLNDSHAAGAYQFEPKLWGYYALRLGIGNFSPNSQDAVFVGCFAENGFAPWAPYDKKLAAAIAAFGGPSAFSLGSMWLVK
jgi:muramidase (phage lysozyme)